MNTGIQKMFDALPARYELINHVITLGLDTRWRRKAARIAARCDSRRGTLLDVSTGTGEMAELLGKHAHSGTAVIACDFSLPMLREAARKLSTRVPGAGTRRVFLFAADDCRLPLLDSSLDVVTISLGTRNLNASRDVLVSCFSEFHRVLRPGGCFVNLETSQPRSRAVRALFHAYVRGFLRPVASRISGNRSAYSYLASTICSFYEAEELTDIIREAGFARVELTRLFLGIAAVHRAEK